MTEEEYAKRILQSMSDVSNKPLASENALYGLKTDREESAIEGLRKLASSDSPYREIAAQMLSSLEDRAEGVAKGRGASFDPQLFGELMTEGNIDKYTGGRYENPEEARRLAEKDSMRQLLSLYGEIPGEYDIDTTRPGPAGIGPYVTPRYRLMGPTPENLKPIPEEMGKRNFDGSITYKPDIQEYIDRGEDVATLPASAVGYTDGLSFSGLDEVLGGLKAIKDKYIEDGEAPLEDYYTANRDVLDKRMRNIEKSSPRAYPLSHLAGFLTNPATRVVSPAKTEAVLAKYLPETIKGSTKIPKVLNYLGQVGAEGIDNATWGGLASYLGGQPGERTNDIFKDAVTTGIALGPMGPTAHAMSSPAGKKLLGKAMAPVQTAIAWGDKKLEDLIRRILTDGKK
jgi:hypothetical protein